jgi:hypothetical protein
MGCAHSQLSRLHTQNEQLFSPVTSQELENAKQHLHLLQAYMTDEEVFHILGLSRFQREASISGGSSSYRYTYYMLRRDPPLNLILYHDYTSHPGTKVLANVEFDGASWK